tara:strand:- start:166 stop:789 length:624 start_codon:yes stop_codon:yes gene_type:complete
MKKITIIDYGCGNLLSIKRGLEKIGFNSEISDDESTILDSTHLILPGVGAFGNAMSLLRKKNLEKTIIEYSINRRKPLLGICLGMQLLLSKSYEFGEYNGLNMISGEVKNINEVSNKELKVPNIGWNEITIEKNNDLFKSFDNKSFYFVHSFISLTNKKTDTAAYCKYFNLPIPSIIQKDKIIGCQFHPEKSGENGLKFLKMFCDLN